jgi:hypothetical protein
MADAFEQFLSDSLAPAERLPDRRFVAGVQARIILEDRLARDRRQLAGSLLMQVAALLAVAAGVWVLGSAAPVAQWSAEFPGGALIILAAGFGLLVAMFSRSAPEAAA